MAWPSVSTSLDGPAGCTSGIGGGPTGTTRPPAAMVGSFNSASTAARSETSRCWGRARARLADTGHAGRRNVPVTARPVGGRTSPAPDGDAGRRRPTGPARAAGPPRPRHARGGRPRTRRDPGSRELTGEAAVGEPAGPWHGGPVPAEEVAGNVRSQRRTTVEDPQDRRDRGSRRGRSRGSCPALRRRRVWRRRVLLSPSLRHRRRDDPGQESTPAE
jgi:hypothetical protein